MSAAPLPKPDGEPGPEPQADAEGWALLEGMRRRLEEQVSQTRKTQAQVTQLADSIAALVDMQRKRARSLNLNSFVAYVVFTMLCGGAFYFLYQSRARELVGGRDRAVGERDAAVRRADEATAKIVARESADAKALDAYQLLATGKHADAAKRLAELRDGPLSRFEREVLAERAKQADVVQVDGALKLASAAFKAGRFGDVVAPLEQALLIETVGPRAAEMHYLVGIAQAKAGELDKAITHLQRSLELDVADEDARFQLASALDRAGQWGKARGEYDRFATARPQSGFAVFAMRRSATLARMPAVAPAAPANAAPTQPVQPTLQPRPPMQQAPVPAPPALPPASKPVGIAPNPPAPAQSPATGAAPKAAAVPAAPKVQPKPPAPAPKAPSSTEPVAPAEGSAPPPTE
jgi:tetratricopeptide (TPR) repeat protein